MPEEPIKSLFDEFKETVLRLQTPELGGLAHVQQILAHLQTIAGQTAGSAGPLHGGSSREAPSSGHLPIVEVGRRVLLVDDDRSTGNLYARVLGKEGFHVQMVETGAHAIDVLEKEEFNVVITDVMMPVMSGVDLLRTIRARDLDVPVVLITAHPDLQVARQALEYGALRYLEKPIEFEELLAVAERATQLHAIAKIKRRAVQLFGSADMQLGDRGALEVGFERALDGLWLAFQPVVSWAQKKILGYEALMRTNESTLPNPGALLGAAERLGRCDDLGRRIRDLVAQVLRDDREALVFINLHPQDLLDEELYSERAAVTPFASRIILEITERASLNQIGEINRRVSKLRALGFRIAVDDLGAGYAGLMSFAQLRPEVVKIDMSLVRGIESEPTKKKLVRSLTNLCTDMSIIAISEGIETVEERDALLELGCDLMQGYLFAKPARGFPLVNW